MRPEGDANYNYPASVIGGGYPVVCDVQGREHVASIGCLVTDGHRTYALTNRHVAGEPGSPIYAIIGGNKAQIGVGVALAADARAFSEAVPRLGRSRIFMSISMSD